MDGDDSDEDEAQVQVRQDAANELQHEYDQDFVPPFDNGGEMSSEGPSCDLHPDHPFAESLSDDWEDTTGYGQDAGVTEYDVDHLYDPYPRKPTGLPA
eukprot:9621142-Heterocapsa_arctica.AAC.1